MVAEFRTPVLSEPRGRVLRSRPAVIKVALIGFGYWGPNLARNLFDACRFDLAAIADTRPDRLRDAARRFPGVETSGEVDRVLARRDIEAGVVATPLAAPHALGRPAAERGKHVLVEKPLAASRADAADLADRAARRGVRLMVDHTFVYTGAVRKLRALISAGELGTLLYLDSVRVNLGLFQHDSNVIWDLA